MLLMTSVAASVLEAEAVSEFASASVIVEVGPEPSILECFLLEPAISQAVSEFVSASVLVEADPEPSIPECFLSEPAISQAVSEFASASELVEVDPEPSIPECFLLEPEAVSEFVSASVLNLVEVGSEPSIPECFSLEPAISLAVSVSASMQEVAADPVNLLRNHCNILVRCINTTFREGVTEYCGKPSTSSMCR